MVWAKIKILHLKNIQSPTAMNYWGYSAARTLR